MSVYAYDGGQSGFELLAEDASDAEGGRDLVMGVRDVDSTETSALRTSEEVSMVDFRDKESGAAIALYARSPEQVLHVKPQAGNSL